MGKKKKRVTAVKKKSATKKTAKKKTATGAKSRQRSTLPRKRAKKKKKRQIEQYGHDEAQRLNNPPVGLVTPETDPPKPEKKAYQYDPHLDPQLVWAGKAEHTSFEVPTVSLHVHERIDPRTIIDAVHLRNGNGGQTQMGLFEDPDEQLPRREAIEFYQHAKGWSNRLVAGDSLLVMNSLLEKEGMAGRVQMIYIDPPYGIEYGSNFQPFTNNRNVKDRDYDLTAEPEMLKAFRDTWSLGIHSYLQYLYARLFLARELLASSGTVFVQIGIENVQRTRLLLDEVFNPSNFIADIIFRKKMMPMSKKPGCESVTDHILWYAKDKSQAENKIHSLFFPQIIEGNSSWDWVELQDGTRRELTAEEVANHELIPENSRIYQPISNKPRQYRENQDFNFEFEGQVFPPPGGNVEKTPDGSHSWSTTYEGMQKLSWARRLQKDGEGLRYVLFHDDYPVMKRTALWADTAPATRMRYVVETAPKVLHRCISLATDPGDLVLDPTCGSGTTAYVAETLGRRWITCDTSRVAITLAKQRLMTAVYEYYKLAHPNEGVGSGFIYTNVPHIERGAIANNPEIKEGMSRAEIDAAIARYADQEMLYDQPQPDKSKVRVSGPFTVEAVPAVTVEPVELPSPQPSPSEGEGARAPMPADSSVARSGATARQEDWRSELLQTGVRGKAGAHVEFTRLEPLPAMRHLHAVGETKGDVPQRAVVSFGPEHAPIEQRHVDQALDEAEHLRPKPDLVLFAAFHFDPEAAKDIDETVWPGVEVLKVQMNADLLTDDLKKKRSSNESFWLIGQPDVEVEQLTEGVEKDKYRVSIHGFDYYNPATGTVDSGGTEKIALWLLDTDYDGRSLYPRQVFFVLSPGKDQLKRLAKTLKAEIDPDLIESYYGTQSLPFEPGEYKRIAVKIVDDRGIESLKIVNLEP